MARIKIAYITINDPLDKRSWSGITYYLGQSLQRNVGDVDFLGPVKPSWFIDKTLRAIAKFTRIIFRKEYNTNHSLLLGWYASKKLAKRMKGRHYDVLIAPAASTEFALLKSDIPSVYVSDTTFALLSNYYKKEFKNLSSVSNWEGNWLEGRSLQKCTVAVLSSRWAARSAENDYQIDPDKISMIPLGANMDFIPSADIIYNKLANPVLTLLFLAVDWDRKGGEIAFDTLMELINSGHEARLIVCGCVPPEKFTHPSVEVIPFLNKNKKEDHDRFIELLSTSHFLILPTRADCSLLVAGEANAYGIPAISTDTGGVSEVVAEGINGYCLPLESPGKEYAELILKIYSDKKRYRDLISSSRHRFQDVLNWDHWADRFVKLYEQGLKP